MSRARQPRLPDWIVQHVAPRSRREEIAGDLAELWDARAGDRGLGRRWFYWRQAISLVWWASRAERSQPSAISRTRRLPWTSHLLQDVRYALRQLRKAPLFAATATLSLAAGIGVNAAIFTLVDRLLLKPLPVEDPHELFFVTDERSLQQQSPRFSYPFYAGLRENDVLHGLAARFVLPLNMLVADRPTRVRGELVSGNYFGVIGAGTQIGRPLTPEDDRTPGSHAVAVISDGFWRRGFGSDASVIGRAVRINNHAFIIIGVAEKNFSGIDVGQRTDVWIPMMMQREVGRDLLAETRTNWIEMIGRLPPGADLERAAAELTAYVEHRAEAMPSQPGGRRLMLLPAGRGNSPAGPEVAAALGVLIALAALALALACVNVASLLVVRSVAREKEIAVRLALGARRSSLVRQFLTETLVLAAAGGATGLLIAPWAAGLLIASQPGLDIDPSLDLRVFLFGLAACVVTGLIVGLAPVLASRRVGLAQAFGHGSPLTPTKSRLTVHDVIVTCQIAVSLVMLIGGALLVQSFRNLSSIDPGFRAENLLLVSVDPGAADYEGVRLETFWREMLDRASRVHGVQSASLARIVPLVDNRQRQRLEHPASGVSVEIDFNRVSPGYFRTLSVPIVAGRDFDGRDRRGSKPVIIVNERLARMFWPDADPVGKTLAVGRKDGPASEVVGVARGVKYRDLRDDAAPMVYVPIFQSGSTDPLTLHVRTATDATELAGTIRREIQMLDANLPVFAINTLEDQLNATFAQIRQAAVLTGGFGILALLLSAVGVYGVTALAVSRRTRDIGIRRALGARPHDIVRVIGRRGLVLLIAGLIAGLAGSFGFARIAGALLHGIAATDVATLASMSALLAAVSLIAIYVPMRAAVRVDPLAAIRSD